MSIWSASIMQDLVDGLDVDKELVEKLISAHKQQVGRTLEPTANIKDRVNERIKELVKTVEYETPLCIVPTKESVTNFRVDNQINEFYDANSLVKPDSALMKQGCHIMDTRRWETVMQLFK